MITKSFFYINSSTYNPFETLALEEAMLNNIKKGEIILYLYTHKKAIIIGKNQNAWKECRFEKLENDGGVMARRISGGGAVYHDMGNLNFSFITNREDYDLRRQLSVILAAVKSFGIPAEFSGRNDILSAGRKFSGNAFCFKKDTAFHHGTILIDVDKENMQKYLHVSEDKIKSKGIASVRSRVCNLKEFNPAINNAAMADALRKAFDKEYSVSSEYQLTKEVENECREYSQRNASWEWRFGYSGNFDITMQQRFAWGEIEICLNLKDAFIENATIYSDAMDADFVASISQHWIGLPFRSKEMTAAILNIYETEEQKLMVNDISEYIISKTI